MVYIIAEEKYLSRTLSFMEKTIGHTKYTLLEKSRTILIEKHSLYFCSSFAMLSGSAHLQLKILKELSEKNCKLFVLSIKKEVSKDNFNFETALQMQEDIISYKTRVALQEKKQQGVKLGRPTGKAKSSKLDKHKDKIQTLLDKNVAVSAIARLIGVHRVTLTTFIDYHKLRQ